MTESERRDKIRRHISAPRFRLGLQKGLIAAVDGWIVNPSTTGAAWQRERDLYLAMVRRLFKQLMEFRPTVAAALLINGEINQSRLDHGFGWISVRVPFDMGPPDEVAGHRTDCIDLYRLLCRVRDAPPPPSPASEVVVDPRDGDGWADAVTRQGVRVPSYDDGYLQSTHWQLLRAERLTGVCAHCRRAARTQLHHVTYERFGAERPEDTRELCAACHRREHPRSWKMAA